MKKLLVSTAVLALGAAAMAAPAAAADGVKLDVAGHFAGYLSWNDQDTTGDDPATAADEGEDSRALDILRETELHFTGETTLDNGMTVGFHQEVDVDGGDAGGDNDDLRSEESYAYFSGAWGRFNFGKEDGAAYLLQVAAPSADSNVDGLRTYIAATNYGIVATAGATAADISVDDLFNGTVAVDDLVSDVDGSDTASAGDIRVDTQFAVAADAFRFDYDQAISGAENKVTYLTPVFSGFQFGVSYTPDVGSAIDSRDWSNGNNPTDVLNSFGSVWDIGARYEGQVGEVGVAVGAGYSLMELEDIADSTAASGPVFYIDDNNSGTFTAADTELATLDDREVWNAGLDLNWGAFGVGVAYLNDDMGVTGDHMERATFVIGGDYTTGPFKLGVSYYDQEQNYALSTFDSNRITGGVVYTYGPGMTFRGSVSWVDHEENLGIVENDFDTTSILAGTQIDF